MLRSLPLPLLGWLFGLCVSAASAQAEPFEKFAASAIEAEDWHGSSRYWIDVQGERVSVVAPRKPALGRPWVWHGEFFGHKPAPDIELLKRGYHIVYMSIPNQLGSPAAVQSWNRCYDVLTSQYGLSPRVALVGLSRGGLYCYNWAIANPEKVACIYGDAPVCDFKSWPGGFGAGTGSADNWQRVRELWNFESDAQAKAYAGNPVDRLEPLAAARIPLLHVFGDADLVVPWEENTGLVAKRYRELGGSIQLIRKPGVGHHPHGLDDPTPIVEFLLLHTGPTVPHALIHQSATESVFEIRSPLQTTETQLRIIQPGNSSGARPKVVYVLPVEAGQASDWGDPRTEILRHRLADRYNACFVLPTFADLPWYADHPSRSELQQETYFIEHILPLVQHLLPDASDDSDDRSLLGFSKSGWGAWSLLLRHPHLFGKAAAWDAPLMMSAPGKYGSGPIFGTPDNFEQYQLSRLVAQFARNPHAPGRLVHAGFGNFESHHLQMQSLLVDLKLQPVYLAGPQREHHWESGWLPQLVEALLGDPLSNR